MPLPYRTSPQRAGRIAAFLLLPQLVLGGYLFAVPDRVTFTVSQCVVLLHVLTALLCLPVAAVLALRHGRGMRAPVERGGRLVTSVTVATAAITGAAFISGFLSVYSGQGMPVATIHAACGLLVALPLAAHFAIAGKPRLSLLSLSLIGASLVGGLWVKGHVPALPETPATPAFSYQTRPAELYDSARWCADCHSSIYKEWSRSIHGRTLEGPAVHQEMTRHADVLELDLHMAGEIAGGRRDYATSGGTAGIIESCTPCHAPLSFYGDDPTPVLAARAPSNEGVTCAFCHTLRDVRVGGSFKSILARATHGLESLDAKAMFAEEPYYVSAPETVRRYLWQGSSRPLLRWLGNWLVRWRPEMHRHDYHPALLDSSLACAGCHGTALDVDSFPVRSYVDWERSRYNTGVAGTTVSCQDCHMSRHATGAPVKEPGRLVWWGPERPQRRSHLFIGGDTVVAERLGDADLAALDHRFNTQAVSTRVVDARRSGDAVTVKVAVKNLMVGHLFPAVESATRYAWVEVSVLEPAGTVLARSRHPGGHSAREPDLAPDASPLIFRCLDNELHVRCSTALQPDEERTFEVRLMVPPDKRISRINADVYHAADARSIASATLPLPNGLLP